MWPILGYVGPILSAYVATAGQGPNYVGPSCGYMLAYVGLMLTHVEPKDPKNGNSKKNAVKRRIF